MQETELLLQDRSRCVDQLIDSAQAGLYVLSLRAEQPVCEYANKTWRRWSGWESGLPDDPQAWLTCFHPEDRLRMQQLYLKVLLTGNPEKTEYRLVSGQQTVCAADTVSPLYDENSCRTVGVCGTALDISLLNSARQEMQRTQLLQALGGLMAGIAHEINTPLQFIGDNLQFIADAWKVLSARDAAMQTAADTIRAANASEAVIETFDKVEQLSRQSNAEFMTAEFPRAVAQSLEGIERLMQLVSAMRDFSHLDERRQEPADLNRAVRSALTLLQNELKYVCDIQTQLDPNLPEISCSIDEINRVLLNLLTNAVHSISEKIEQGRYTRGCIQISTSTAADSVKISVRDNGTGIGPEIRDRIFERYFTTKRNHPERRGTGQGLAMVYETVVDHHRGALTFDSTPGEGTVFNIVLPLHTHSADTTVKEQRGYL